MAQVKEMSETLCIHTVVTEIEKAKLFLGQPKYKQLDISPDFTKN